MDFSLRPWRLDDAAALADIYGRADADLLRNVPDDRSLAGAQAWIESIRAAEESGSVRAWAIVGSVDSFADSPDAPVGNIMASGINTDQSTAWISYWLDARARGRGLAAAALRSMVDHLHDELGIHRLELGYRTNNPASAAVAARAGFLVEGREREKLLYDGVRFDTEICARLTTDPRSTDRRLSFACR